MAERGDGKRRVWFHKFFVIVQHRKKLRERIERDGEPTGRRKTGGVVGHTLTTGGTAKEAASSRTVAFLENSPIDSVAVVGGRCSALSGPNNERDMLLEGKFGKKNESI